MISLSLSLMQTLKSQSILSHYHFNNIHLHPIKPIFCLFSSLSSHVQNERQSLLFDYLIKTLNFSQKQAFPISNRYSRIKSLAKPQYFVHYLQNLGFSNNQIKSSVLLSPQLLFSDIDKTVKPKIKFFQDLGLVGFELGRFISMNSMLLSHSLEKRLVPHIEIIKKALVNDENKQDLTLVVRRGSCLFRCPKERLSRSIAFLKSCGIVGSQLSMLFKRQPRIFVMQESTLKDLVSRVLDQGVSVESRMFVHGLYTLSCLSDETYERKLELFRSFGFSEKEVREMFTRMPGVMRGSVEKLKLGLEFFLNTVKFDKVVICRTPTCLMHNIEDRVIPRYKVLQVLKSKKLLEKEPSFIRVLKMSEEEFLERFVARFCNDVEELLVAYKGHLCSFEEEEKD